MRRGSLLLILAVLVGACGAGGDIPSDDRPTSPRPSATGSVVKIVIPPAPGAGESIAAIGRADAREMTLADLIREDPRFTVFRQLAEQTLTSASARPSWLELWDRPASLLGDDHHGLTIFVPTDEAFADVDPAVRVALAEGALINAERYWLLGSHTVHRLFASSEFRDGPVGSWEGDVEMTIDPLAYGGQPILQTDLRVANGYVHVIGGVVVPELVMKAATD